MEILEVLTVGLPFCGFKLLAAQVAPGVLKYPLLIWGLLDLVINVANLLSLVLRRTRMTEACLITIIVTGARRELGNAIDVLGAFLIVAVMVGGGMLRLLAPAELELWNACVVLNVLGAGFGRVAGALKKTHDPEPVSRGRG
jgi:hypothetical protein